MKLQNILEGYIGSVMRKNQIRRRVWKLMEQKGVVLFPGAQGRIPNFKGADQAAKLLSELPEWRRAHVISPIPIPPKGLFAIWP